ncbi:DEAD/DEAH box helicase, partial [Gammaproteobacteria bacterium]|nr:DEAD/DEAH box helicase [Gammaproteobacteria bacterium]
WALAELRQIGAQLGESVKKNDKEIVFSHRILALLSALSAEVLGLPVLTNLVFVTETTGVLGQPSYQLAYRWYRDGRPIFPTRVGAILERDTGPQRLPAPIFRAINVAESFNPGDDLHRHWTALAEFRRALSGDEFDDRPSEQAQIRMSDFLDGLKVRTSDGFSIAPHDSLDDFDPVPFSGRNLSKSLEGSEDHVADESHAELQDEELNNFQQRFRDHGARGAYRYGDGSYLVVDHSLVPVLDAIKQVQDAPVEYRRAFIKNPTQVLSEAIRSSLQGEGKLDALSDIEIEELVEETTQCMFVETRQYSERVVGVATWSRPELPFEFEQSTGTTWFPEEMISSDEEMEEKEALASIIAPMSAPERTEVLERIEAAEKSGQESISIAGEIFLLRPWTKTVVNTVPPARPAGSGGEKPADSDGPVVIDTKENFVDLDWLPEMKPRPIYTSEEVPGKITAELYPHQREAFSWMRDCWSSGMPGMLLADDQGLGKTLQTIAFIAWLQDEISACVQQSPEGLGKVALGPQLVVAPTTLLKNWENEVDTHTGGQGLGCIHRLYGSHLKQYKKSGSRGTETVSGEEQLDLEVIRMVMEECRGHTQWVLTTYKTLSQYHHSLASIPFSAVVFDEIQALKNPLTLASKTARSVNAAIRLGLTGTPIENRTADLWSIIDQIAAGRALSLKEFQERYAQPDEDNMRELHHHVFNARLSRPALALRRMKEDVVDLPPKRRFLHPHEMPDPQVMQYNAVRSKLRESEDEKKGDALRMLHDIRSISIHPNFYAKLDADEFIAASARLAAVFDILDDIERAKQKALVFIENLKMQYRFAQLAESRYGLAQVDIINGSTPIPQRQSIVDVYQHGRNDGRFNVLVLGPKSAGTGITLTAATHVIHLSRWWNPAVEEQCNDRVHRIGQTEDISIHIPMAVHPDFVDQSFDCLLHRLMQRKRKLATSVLWPAGDLSDDVSALQAGLSGDGSEHGRESSDLIRTTMQLLFDDLQEPLVHANGHVYEYQ